MPCTPTAERLSFTSSSLKGLMIASTFFIVASRTGTAREGPRLRQPLCGCKGDLRPISRVGSRSFEHLRDAAHCMHRLRVSAVRARERAAVAAGREQVGVLAVL